MLQEERIRWLLAKRPSLLSEGKVFGSAITESRLDSILYRAAIVEIERNLILLELEDGPKTVHQLEETTDIPKAEIVKHLIALRRWRKVDFGGREGRAPLYRIT